MSNNSVADTCKTASLASVLLVEDNLISSKVQTKMLEHKGFNVLHVDNGYAAIQCIKQASFNAIIMDLNMPVLNGYETTELIREWEKQQDIENIPIIALTASSAPEQEQYIAKGINYYIEKPLNDNNIRHILHLIQVSKSQSAKH